MPNRFLKYLLTEPKMYLDCCDKNNIAKAGMSVREKYSMVTEIQT